MMLHFNHHIGMDVATLEQFRNILSMYVHPVIRNDELDIYNTFGLNHNNSNNYSNSNHINAYNSNLRNQQKQIARRRHGAEAEIRSVSDGGSFVDLAGASEQTACPAGNFSGSGAVIDSSCIYTIYSDRSRQHRMLQLGGVYNRVLSYNRTML